MLSEKNKKAKSYATLQKTLMSKFDQLQLSQPKPNQRDQLGFLLSDESYHNQSNVHDLIRRAKHITEKNHGKLTKAKRILQTQKKNTFLTGVNIIHPKEAELEQDAEEVGETSLLHEVVAIKTDDLEELMRMIRETGSKINGCGRDVKDRVMQLVKAKTQVMDVADRIGKPMNNRIASNIDKYPEFVSRAEQKPTSQRKFGAPMTKKLLKLL